MKLISWNIAHRPDLWSDVAALDADVALLQEACEPPAALTPRLGVEPDLWRTEGKASRNWRTSVVGIRPDIEITRIPTRPLVEAGPAEVGVSRLGTLAAARVKGAAGVEPITLISMYATWESPQRDTGGSWIYADGSAHRLISDLSALVGQVHGHRIIAAGDLNCLYGHGEQGSQYWEGRYRTVFDRFAAIGLSYVGPQSPNGRQASPWPDELPGSSLNVPTYHTRQQTPESATRQLDFVFASADLVPRLSVRALNSVAEWGRSDHCRVEIAVS